MTTPTRVLFIPFIVNTCTFIPKYCKKNSIYCMYKMHRHHLSTFVGVFKNMIMVLCTTIHEAFFFIFLFLFFMLTL